MTTPPRPASGTIGWFDLTVPDAPLVRDFYQAVAGWQPSPVSMGEYDDFNMTRGDGTPVAGVCHARGVNANLPPYWLIYIVVSDLDASLKACLDRGGAAVGAPTVMGDQGRYCVIQDPAGAFAALYEPA